MLNTPILSLDMVLSRQLKKLIQDSGISLTHLSRSTKISVQTIHNWVSGSKPRDFDQVKRVADHFNVTLDFLVYGIEVKSKSSPLNDFDTEINAGIYEVVLRKIKK